MEYATFVWQSTGHTLLELDIDARLKVSSQYSNLKCAYYESNRNADQVKERRREKKRKIRTAKVFTAKRAVVIAWNKHYRS